MNRIPLLLAIGLMMAAIPGLSMLLLLDLPAEQVAEAAGCILLFSTILHIGLHIMGLREIDRLRSLRRSDETRITSSGKR